MAKINKLYFNGVDYDIGEKNIHDLTEKATMVVDNDELMIADSEDTYSHKKIKSKNIRFDRVVDFAKLGENMTAGDYKGAVFYGKQQTLSNSGASTTKNIGNSASDYLEFTVNLENNIIQKLLLDPLTIVGDGGGNLTVTFTGLESSITNTTLTITQVEATAVGGFDIAAKYKAQYGIWLYCQGYLTIKVEQTTTDGANYYTTEIDSNSLPNYTIWDGLESDKVWLSDTRYLVTRKCDGIILDSGSAGDIVRVQTNGSLKLSSGLYDGANMYLNNGLTDGGTIGLSNTGTAMLGNGIPYNCSFGTFAGFKTFSATLNYSTSKSVIIYLYLNGELLATDSGRGGMTMTYTSNDILTGELTATVTTEYAGSNAYFKDIQMNVFLPDLPGGYNSTENTVCIGVEDDSRVRLFRGTNLLRLFGDYKTTLRYQLTYDTTLYSNIFSFGTNGTLTCKFFNWDNGGHYTTKVQFYKKGTWLDAYTIPGSSYPNGTSDILFNLPISKGLLYRFCIVGDNVQGNTYFTQIETMHFSS